MTLTLPTPEEFPAFPFVPYDIQLDLMKNLYTSIEESKVAIIESPTGTGKTMSLLCGSLTWLRDEQLRAKRGQLDVLIGGDGPDWVLAQTVERKRRELEANEREYAEALTNARKKEAVMRKLAQGRVRKRRKLDHAVRDNINATEDEDAFLPDLDEDRDPDDEDSNLSPAVRELMRKLQGNIPTATGRQVQEKEPVCTKIYYASRTHSQLAQVLHELQKLDLQLNVVVSSVSEEGSAYPGHSAGLKRTSSSIEETSISLIDQHKEGCNVRAVSLGSRKQLCINEHVRSRATDLDEACRQLLGEKGSRRCEYLPPQDEEIRMLDLRDQILATPKDIEDLVLTGQAAETCPYFGSRKAIPQAQIVLLPYNLLLQKTAREALGIDLENQIVLIDEAHNLVSTLLSLSTTRLPARTLSQARHQLSIYLTRFRTRLATMHALHLARLLGFLDALAQYAEEWRAKYAQADSQKQPGIQTGVKARQDSTEVMTSGELLSKLGRKTEGVNLLEVEVYLRHSKVARKISGYSVKALEKAAGDDPTKLAKLARLSNNTPPLHAIESFITTLTAANDDGRVTFSLVEGQVEIKYQHLNPSTYFREVVDDARAVVLAGGTMSPISDVANQLFHYRPTERLSIFSCGHIIPPTNLQAIVFKKGPRGADLQFKYEQRNDQQLIAELGQMLLNFCSIVPGGLVVFLPSYSFLNAVTAAWQKSGLLSKLRAKKKVFSEPQESAQVEGILREYSAEIHRPRQQDSTPPDSTKRPGAVLFAVIGAKLSEGLNFTDDLARAVVIVGLPYANLASPELQERMKYVNRLQQRSSAASSGSDEAKAAPAKAGMELYENMCMNAVNQSIGRAIRHKGDWASLMLVDCRYAAPRIRNKLPKWIGENTTIADSFGQAMKALGSFYRVRREG